MLRNSALIKASIFSFISSFCLMVIELIAGRILAPYIGVSLYTWTSIIGVIMAGIALGNYAGGKIADQFPTPKLLIVAYFLGGLATVAILPVIWLVTTLSWFNGMPVILNFTLKVACIFFLPAVILSVVSPIAIKLALADLGKAGGIAGTIYAWSTAGSILGTFLTGFYLILWFGIRMIVWIVAGVLILTGIAVWLFWTSRETSKFRGKNAIIPVITVITLISYVTLFSMRAAWQVTFVRESNYYSIQIYPKDDETSILALDHLIHSYVKPNDSTYLGYSYLKVFSEFIKYEAKQNPQPSVLHLGGGGYSFPRYLEAVYPGSVNDVVEIDPAVTEVAQAELGLQPNTTIRTYNQDARLFLMQEKPDVKYDFVIGDVFNDLSTPYHLTTLEFDKMVKASMKDNGIYLVNIIDKYQKGQYMPSFVQTLKQVFGHVYLISPDIPAESTYINTFVIAATDRSLDLNDLRQYVTDNDDGEVHTVPMSEEKLDEYLQARKPILLTDDYAPTDILVSELFQ